MTTRPTTTARWVVGLSVRWLELDDRVRYREELNAELCDLAKGRQLRHALSALRGTYALRRALARQIDERDLAITINWRCRLQWHRFVARPDPNVVPDSTARPVRYVECARCGRYSTIAARRRNYAIGSAVVAALLWILAPMMIAIVLTLGLGAGVAATFAGDSMQMELRGPGHQYREPPPRR